MRRTRNRRRPSKTRLIRADDLRHYHFVSDPQISPDGGTIVFVKKHVNEKNEYVTNLWMVDALGQTEPRQFTSGGKDSHPRWSSSEGGPLIAFIGGREKTKPQIYTIPAPGSGGGGEAIALTNFPEGAIASFKWSPNGSMIAVSFRATDPEWIEDAKKSRKDKGLSDPPRVIDDWWYRLDGDGYFNAQRHHLYIVDATTGAHRKLYDKDAMGHFTFDWSPDSRKIVMATNRDRKAMIKPWKDELVIIDVSSGKLKRLDALPDGVKYGPLWSPDGRHIAYAGHLGKDGLYSVENVELWVCDADGRNARSLTGRENYCLMSIAISDSSEVRFSPSFLWSSDSKRLYVQIGWHGESHIASIPTRGGKLKFHTGGARVHTLGSASADGKSLTFTMGTATVLDEVLVSHLSPRRVIKLTDFNGPLLSQLNLAQPQAAWVKSTDGARVQTWMLKPPNYKRGKKYPAVLEIHGGPHAMYGVGFFHEFQLLAAQGYAVFFSNPRGSKGYGQNFCAPIKGAWGGKDWDDIQAVTMFMKSQRVVNPKRLGVMGGSYGGYMTNWVIGHTNDFAGAITDRCVSNLVSMLGSSDYIEEPDRYWQGNSWDRPEAVWNQSPLKYFGNAKTPTLIIHSEGDLRCNIEQSEQVFSALKLLNVPVRLVRYPASTSHGMSRNGPPDLRVHRLNQIAQWWKQWL
jgi:dipeptidyl aminopeptidase/acylaminoacyl peptidase